MGTYITPGATQADVIAEITRRLRDSQALVTFYLGRESDGEPVLWTVERFESCQYIGCYVLRSDGSGWGYKPLSEMVGPCFYSVPLDWFDRYECKPPANAHGSSVGYSDQWRAKVRDIRG